MLYPSRYIIIRIIVIASLIGNNIYFIAIKILMGILCITISIFAQSLNRNLAKNASLFMRCI